MGTWTTGSGAFYRRLESGGSVRAKRCGEVLQWCSDHWPNDLTWPAGLQRPAPNAEAPPPPRAVAVHAVRRAMERYLAAMDDETREAAMRDALEIGMRLDPATGRVACPDALCIALRVERHTYDYVVSRYAMRPKTWPRRSARQSAFLGSQSATDKMFRALRDAGDVRFQPPTLTRGAAAGFAQLTGRRVLD